MHYICLGLFCIKMLALFIIKRVGLSSQLSFLLQFSGSFATGKNFIMAKRETRKLV